MRWATLLPVLPLVLITTSLAADWPPLSPGEMSMTSVQEQPGAPAVILLREEIDDDMNNFESVYERIKILTDAGRDYANVELPYRRRGFRISDICGRTIHRDGSIVRFEGKPLDKTIVKGNGIRINEIVFTLPDVQVGSIIEFRYKLLYDDHRVLPPTWEVQNELFQRKTYFKFIPFQNHGNMEIMLDHDQIARGIAWKPILGKGNGPQLHKQASTGMVDPHQVSFWVDLSLDDVPAFTDEPFMPPASVMKWRVYFYYQQNLKAEDYWKSEGKFWNKDVESFVGKDRGIGDALAKLIAPSDTPEQKVRKIYAFVAAFENQDYRPARSVEERKVLELKRNRSAEDVLEHHSGTHDDLNRLFVAMARAARIPAALILVPDRGQQVFIKDLPTMSQFEGEIAIVQLAGKDIFLDPGTKFCPYGILDWRYTGVTGLRQNGKATEFGETPSPAYNQFITTRMAAVSLDEQGFLSGTVTLVYKGTAALQHRQEGGKTDSQGRTKLLEEELRGILPGNSEVSLINSPRWEDAESPLVAQFRIRCPYVVAAGKRLMISEHLFQVNEKPRFPAAQRTSPVYFRVPWQEADEVHMELPPGMEVESLPPDDSIKLAYALYQVRHKQEAPNKIFSRRDFIMGQGVFPADEYKEIKAFFDKVESDDGQAALLRVSTSVAVTQ